jgi:hypothetical protein
MHPQLPSAQVHHGTQTPKEAQVEVQGSSLLEDIQRHPGHRQHPLKRAADKPRCPWTRALGRSGSKKVTDLPGPRGLRHNTPSLASLSSLVYCQPRDSTLESVLQIPVVTSGKTGLVGLWGHT